MFLVFVFQDVEKLVGFNGWGATNWLIHLGGKHA